MHWHLRILPTLLVTLTLGACEPARRESPEIHRDTLAGGGIQVRGPAEGIWQDGDAWTLSEEFRLGSMEGRGPDVFGDAWAVELDQTGRLYVLDRIAKEVRVFDTDGSHLRTFGNEGEGPGEFRDPIGLAWDPDGRLWVVDVRLGRYSVFDTAGRHHGESPRRVLGYSWPWPGRFTDDGLLYEPSLMDDRSALISFNPAADLTVVDSFPLHRPEADGFWNLTGERGFGAVIPIPFAGQAEWVLDAEARVWVGVGSRYSLARRTPDGDTLLVVERAVEPFAVPAAQRDQAIEKLNRLGEWANHPKLDLSRIPKVKPFFRRLIPDTSGNLWVLREGDGASWFFDVFRADGVYLGAVDLPVEPALLPPPLVRSDRMVVVSEDDVGVDRVIVYGIQRKARYP